MIILHKIPHSRTIKLNLAKRDMGRCIESRKAANSVEDKEESKLLNAKNTVGDSEKLNTES